MFTIPSHEHKQLVYIAGPYTAQSKEELLSNTERAMDISLQVFKKGYIPHVPHLTHFLDMRAKETGYFISYEEWMAWDHSFLELCDCLLYYAPSPGADRELAWAKTNGLKIYYSVDEM